MNRGEGRPLTEQMLQHLQALADGASSAYSAGLSLGTLNALEKRALVHAMRGLGSIAFPHTNIIWTITHKGRTALTSGEGMKR